VILPLDRDVGEGVWRLYLRALKATTARVVNVKMDRNGRLQSGEATGQCRMNAIASRDAIVDNASGWSYVRSLTIYNRELPAGISG